MRHLPAYHPRLTLASLVLLTLPTTLPAQTQSVVNSKHNLSVSGPGALRSTNEQQVCIFCHTPHNATPVQPLWNRNMPVTAYVPYSSNSLQAKPGQPTGASKLCLSCHDGTIALGSVVSANQPIMMAGGITTLPPGTSNLGTDLSDDHPISFRYDPALVAKNAKLKDPGTLPPSVRLDRDKELQCTSCHEAHDNRYGNFLVMDNSSSQLCNTCHTAGTTTITEHTSCNACHQSHTAPSRAYLLRGQTVTDTCTRCHNGTPAAGPDVLTDLAKVTHHDTKPSVNLTTDIPDQSSCNDCHASHTMQTGTAAAPLISPKLGAIAGVSSSGTAVPAAQFQYEVCFKCHADQATTKVRAISRVIVQLNKRFQFDTSAASFHPVESAGRSSDVPSLAPGYTTASVIYCSDCHNSDTSTLAGSSGANGPHGSANAGLLIAPYATADGVTESANTYALCYRCHQRSSILSNQSFSSHSFHVTDQRISCSICHDSHGISSAQGNQLNNAHLINFDTSVVQPFNGVIAYASTGPRMGTCTLTCHGSIHDAREYPPTRARIKGRQIPLRPAPHRR